MYQARGYGVAACPHPISIDSCRLVNWQSSSSSRLEDVDTQPFGKRLVPAARSVGDDLLLKRGKLAECKQSVQIQVG